MRVAKGEVLTKRVHLTMHLPNVSASSVLLQTQSLADAEQSEA